MACGETVSGDTSVAAVHQARIRSGSTQPMRAAHVVGERKLVTVLFADVVGSTALAEQLDPEEWTAIMNGAFERLCPVIERYGGTVARLMGDALLAFFGAPTAHEDDAVRAVSASLDLLHVTHDLAVEVRHEYGVDFAIRVGLSTGQVVLGDVGTERQHEYTAMGDAPNLAARMQAAARPMSVLIAGNTHQRVASAFDCIDRGMLKVKGKTSPVRAFEVVRRRVSRGVHQPMSLAGRKSPSDTPAMVGRLEERAILNTVLEQLTRGEGGLAIIVGEAGLGKSRLVEETRRQWGTNNVLWLEGRTLAYGQTISYWPFLEILRADAGIVEDDVEAVAWSKLETRAKGLFPRDSAEVLPYLASLVGLAVQGPLTERVKYLDGQAMGHQIFRSTRRFFERVAQEHPVVLVLEDAHWMDQSSVDLLEHLLPLVNTVPLMICLLSRPDLNTPYAHLRAVATQCYADRYREITLTPLSHSESMQLISNVLASDELSTRLKGSILRKAEGNPFFVEELVRTLVEIGAVVGDEASGHWRAITRLETLAIPDTIQGVIAARLDRLDEDALQVVKTAAVIGRNFFYRVLRAVTPVDEDLDRRLRELEEIELIRTIRRTPELEYIFKHALTREAAYESILLRQRRELHHRVARSIEELFASRIEELYALLAYHFARAEDWPKAHEYLLKAGDQARGLAADTEALELYRNAIAAYENVFGARWQPMERAELERKIGDALFARGEHQQARDCFRRALEYLGMRVPGSRWRVRVEIARQIIQQSWYRIGLRTASLESPSSELSAVAEARIGTLRRLFWIDFFVNPEALVLDALLILNVSEQSGHALGIVEGSITAGVICDLMGAFGIAERYHQRAARLMQRVQNPRVVAEAYLARGLHEYLCRGETEVGLAYYERAAAAYWEAGDLRGWGASMFWIAWLVGQRGDLERAQEESRRILRVGTEGADHLLRVWGLQALGRVLACLGSLDEAVAHLEEALKLAWSVPDYEAMANTAGVLGQCYLRQGRVQEAISVLEDSSRLIVQRGFRGWIGSPTRTGLAEAYLAAAERADGKRRRELLNQGKRACHAALAQARVYPQTLAQATRLCGTYELLAEDPRRAHEWWQKSLAAAEKAKAPYELALTYLAIGQRLGKREDLEHAESIFAGLGAKWDLAQTRATLDQLGT